MKFKKGYKKFISSIDLSNEEYENIRKNIINKKVKNKLIFKLKYAYVLIPVLLIGIISYKTDIVSAIETKIYQYFSITENKEKFYFNSKPKAILNKKYNEGLFIKDEYYNFETLENKLGVKLLKNKYIKNDLFRASKVEVKNHNITCAGFLTVDNDKSLFSTEDIELSIFFQTQDSNKDSSLSIGGIVTYSTYSMKNLDTEALLVKLGPTIIAEFAYDDILYSIEIDDILNHKELDKVNYDKVYKILDAFTA